MSDLWGLHTAADHGGWYHVTHQKLSPGDRITPGGGESRWTDDNAYADRGNHVWLSDDDDHVGYWLAQFQKGLGANGLPNLYKVHPDQPPTLYDENDPLAGHVTSGATVVQQHDPHDFMPWLDGHHTASTDGIRYAHRGLHTAAGERRKAFDPLDDYYFPGYDYGPAVDGELEDHEATQADMETAWLIGEGSTRRKPHIQRGIEQGPAHPDAPLTDTERWLQNTGHEFAKKIHQAEPNPDYLYRGMTVPPGWVDKVRQSSSVSLPLSSFSVDASLAYDYSRPDPGRSWAPRSGHSVIMRVEPGSKSHPIADDEDVSHGDFDVLDSHLMTHDELRDEYGNGSPSEHLPTTVLHVRQRSVPEPVNTDGIRYARRGLHTAADYLPMEHRLVPLTDLITPDMTGVLYQYDHFGYRSETPDEPVYLKVRHDIPGKYELADGHHRVADAIRNGKDHVWADIDPYEDDEPYEPPFYDFSQHMGDKAVVTPPTVPVADRPKNWQGYPAGTWNDQDEEEWNASHTASTDGIRYAHVVEADVAEDLHRVAMPAADAYDTHVRPEHRDTEQSIKPGPYFHATDQPLKPGDVILPLRDVQDKIPTAKGRNQNYSDMGYENHANWVWMMRHPAEASNYGKYVYHVQPEVEGPWSWNNEAFYDGEEYPNHRYVAPRARVIQQMHTDEYGYYPFPDDDDHHTASTDGIRYAHVVEADVAEDLMRLAMPAWYHLTDNPDFQLDPSHKPTNFNRDEELGNGIFLSQHPDLWSDIDSNSWNGNRPYVVEIEAPDDLKDSSGVWYPHKNKPEYEMFVPSKHFHQLNVKNVRPRNARLAMAWQDWAPKIQGGCKVCTHRDDGNGSHGEYWIEHEPTSGPVPGDALAGGKLVSNLSFFHDVGRDGVPELFIAGIHTSSGHRNDGVAEALMRRMHEDHPNTRINPGFMTDDGQAFHDKMLERDPSAKSVLARLAMPMPMPEGVTFHHHPTNDTIPTDPWPADPSQLVPRFSSPAVEARHNGETVGYLEWDPPLHATVVNGIQYGDHPPEVSMIKVHPDYRRHGIGTALFDFARQHQGDLEHSDSRTGLGNLWVDYEQSRSRALARLAAAVGEDLLGRLHDEFHDWAKDAIARGRLRSTPNDPERGHIGNWGTVENFLLDKYPMASLGLDMGMEEAGPTLDGRPPKYLTFQGEQPSYETGPEAHAKYGYDPAEIAASMLLLHNRSHPLRNDISQYDQDRLDGITQNRQQSLQDVFDRHEPIRGDMPQSDVDMLHGIAQTRHRQQQVYEQRNARLAAVSDEKVNQLRDEFLKWYDHTGHASDTNASTRLKAQEIYNLKDKGPLSNWLNIEKFLKDRYPAAHRGLTMGMEHAGPLLDGQEPWQDSGEPTNWQPYQTGHEAVAEHGYDPKGVAAAFMLMHLQAHGGRNRSWPGITDEAQQRLVDIFDKRQRMQRNYEQRTAQP